MPRWTVLCGLLLLCWVASLGDARHSAAVAPSSMVAIDGVAFVPETLTVPVGATVVWVNNDPFPHTVTSQAGGFDSPAIAPGQSWSYTTTRAGVFPYLCTLHPTMQATLKVE